MSETKEIQDPKDAKKTGLNRPISWSLALGIVGALMLGAYVQDEFSSSGIGAVENRVTALKKLDRADPKTRGALIGALQDSSKEVRRTALSILTASEPTEPVTEALPEIQRLLGSKRPQTRILAFRAVRALIPAERAVPTLAKAVREDKQVRLTLIRWMADRPLMSASDHKRHQASGQLPAFIAHWTESLEAVRPKKVDGRWRNGDQPLEKAILQALERASKDLKGA